MKKCFTVFLSVLMVIVISITVFSANMMPGDVDGNGIVTASDARSVIRMAAALDTFTSEQTAVADIDNSGNVTASDARKILRVSAGLDSLESGNETPVLPDSVKALLNGNFRFSYSEDFDYYEYEDSYGMKDGTVYIISTGKDTDENQTYVSGYILYQDGTCYEFDMPEMIACAVDEDYIEYWGDIDYVRILGAIDDAETTMTVAKEKIGDVDYDVYTFSTAYGTMKFLLENNEVRRYICYDKEHYELVNMEIDSFANEYDADVYTADMFTVYSFEEYSEYWSSDYYEDYYSEEYWAAPVDWSNVEGTVISDEKDLPEEYKMLTADKYHLSSFCRTVAGEGELFADGDYYYTESDIYFDNGVAKVASGDMLGLSVFYTMENDKLACYLVYDEGGIYNKVDKYLVSVLGLDYDEVFGFDASDIKLIEDKPHTVMIRECTIDDNNYMNLICAYEDGSYVSEFTFMNHELIRIDEYTPDGEEIGVIHVYDFSEDFEESVSLDGYEEVSSIAFIAAVVGF